MCEGCCALRWLLPWVGWAWLLPWVGVSWEGAAAAPAGPAVHPAPGHIIPV